MYEQVFGFTARPFASTPVVQNYFPAESIDYSLSQARLCIDRASGPVIAMGPSGTGKSLMLTMLSEYYANEFQIVHIFCSNLVERKSLLQHVLFELNLPYREMSEGELRLSLIDYLKSIDSRRPNILMLVDEANTLSSELLDELRAITNFVRNGAPAISLVMAGTPVLESNLIDTKSESFNQRIAARCYLSNLGRNETGEYVLTQVERAGGNAETLFTGEALNKIYEVSDGCPRIINQVCDYALVLAAHGAERRVTSDTICQAWGDVQSIPTPSSSCNTSQSNDSVVSIQNDDVSEDSSGDMVIEFGQLDDGGSTASTDTAFENIDNSFTESPDNNFSGLDNHDDDTVTFVVGEDEPQNTTAESETLEFVVDPELAKAVEDAEEYRLERLDDEVEDKRPAQETSQFIDFDYSIVAGQTEQDFKTWAVAGSETESTNESIVASTPTEPAGDFEDPFKETFANEENIDLSHVPYVSAQNINSLMITREQLSLLDEPQTEVQSNDHDTPALVTLHQYDREQDHQHVSVPAALETVATELVADPDNAPIAEQDEIETVAADELNAIDQMQADIRRLQRELQFSQQNDTSTAAHPDYEMTAEADSDNSVVDNTSTAAQQVDEVADTNRILFMETNLGLADTISSTYSATSEIGEDMSDIYAESESQDVAEEVANIDDDRDMMIISQPEKFQTQSIDDEQSDSVESRISNGRAERMDYHDLFRQLRATS